MLSAWSKQNEKQDPRETLAVMVGPVGFEPTTT
jgi:hypothetical protein